MIYFVLVHPESTVDSMGLLFNENDETPIFTTREKAEAFLKREGILARIERFDSEKNKEFFEENDVIIDPK